MTDTEFKDGRFLIEARNEQGWIKNFIYDTRDSSLVHEDGTPVDLSVFDKPATPRHTCDIPTPFVGKRNIRRLRIQMGLSCNYSCEYCSQRFVPHSEEKNRRDAEAFMEKMSSWFEGGTDGKGAGVTIEFWGGEPFVYWKTLKPLAEGIRERYPNAEFWMPTNGSLLDEEKNEWLDRLGFQISVSHDGPGQFVRGPDPLDDPKQRAAILDLFNRLHPKGRFAFAAMLNSQNVSRSAIIDFFIKLTGRDDVVISEGEFIDAYDEGGASVSVRDEDSVLYRRFALSEMREDERIFKNMATQAQRVTGFINSILEGRKARFVGQKCGMERPDQLAVDLHGNVMTCQNVSAAAIGPNGQSHLAGSVDDLASVHVKSSQHWKDRSGCSQCPVLHLCKGSCMFLDGPLWDSSCENAFSDAIPVFAVAFEMLTGHLPVRITGGREDRTTLWEYQDTGKKRKKVFPIKFAGNDPRAVTLREY